METHNNKKYPINPVQIVTERKGCIYCPRTYPDQNSPDKPNDNTHKCGWCGIGSIELVTGLLSALYMETHLPMVLIERVKCEFVDESSLGGDTGYYMHDGEFYQLINASKFFADGIKKDTEKNRNIRQESNVCYEYRRNSCWLEPLCNKEDILNTKAVFTAIDNNIDSFFQKYTIIDEPGNECGSFEYYQYKCKITGLTETIIPIYTTDMPDNRSERGVIGLLLVGQFAIGDSPERGRDMPVDLKDSEKGVIQVLRDDSWTTAANEGRVYSHIHEALKIWAKEIDLFRKQMQDRIKLRETDFLHIYQTRLINRFLDVHATCDFSTLQTALDDRISEMFKTIWADFDLKQIFVFIPDLQLQTSMISNRILGINLDNERLDYSISLYIDKMPTPSSFVVNINEMVLSGCIEIRKTTDRSTVELDDRRLKDGYYEFYAAMSNDSNQKTVFGVFLEWNKLSAINGEMSHKALFKALIAVCYAEIMAYVDSCHAKRLSSFAEETRHDLSHRLQTVDVHNKSFEYDCINFFHPTEPDKAKNIARFEDYCMNYLQANRELFEMLTFMNDELDSVNIYRDPKPEKFNVYFDVLRSLRQLYTAPWHPRNNGQELLVDPSAKWPEKVGTDKVMFRRIVTNLVDNAFKYSSPKTNVHIVYNYNISKKEMTIDITNFGTGIEEEFKEDIFKHGVKGARIAAGKGLGLYIARLFAERNGGGINIISGIIPKSGLLEDKKKNGLVTLKNFTVVNEIKEWLRKNPDDSRATAMKILHDELICLTENLRSEKQLHYTLQKSAGTHNALNDILVNPDVETPLSRKKEDPIPTAWDLMDKADSELYQITFRLILPSVYITYAAHTQKRM